jgi:hydroxyacyl-ACP dehydratase HTD2-like protein with hotdog domain
MLNVTSIHSYYDDELDCTVQILKVKDNEKVSYEKEYLTREGDYIDSEKIEADEVAGYMRG